MSGDLLRRAAVRLRERADAASPGPWFYNSYSGVYSQPKVHAYDGWIDSTGDHSLERRGPCPDCGADNGCVLAAEAYNRGPVVASVPPFAGDSAHGEAAANATFIETMHPPVARALADLLQGLSWLQSQADPADLTAAYVVAREVLRERPGTIASPRPMTAEETR